MALIKLSAIERRRVSAFFTCLVLAAMAWIFTTLSNPIKFGVKVVLNYKNAPQKRAYHSLQSDTIVDSIKSTGWQMLFSRINNQNQSVDVDLRSLDTRDYIVLSSQLKQINDKRDPEQQIASFTPDTLYFDFSNRTTKKVLVRLVSGVNYQHQFEQSNDVRINPAYVTLSGPGSVIDNIQAWSTDSLIMDSVNETVRTTLALQPVKEGNVSVYPKSVQVVLPVDEYTEKMVEIPVKLINNHNYYNVKVFPQKVKVTFTTTLKRYAAMDDDFFEAVADLDLWRDNGYSTLPVKLTRLPAYCKIVKIEPQNIDFIIRK
jgi:hypothetical protein